MDRLPQLISHIWVKIIMLCLIAYGCGGSNTRGFKMKAKFVTDNHITQDQNVIDQLGGCDRDAKKWGVVVGINDYLSPLITDLDGAAVDAWSFYHYLTSPFGARIPSSQVTLLVNDKATRANIEGSIGNLKACEQDQVYIYFAGHGMPEPNQEENAFLLAYDSDPTNMVGSAISMQKLPDFLSWRVGKASRLLMVIDACHSGNISLKKNRGFKLKPSTLKVRETSTKRIKALNASIDKLSQKNEGWGVISAAASNQLAEESSTSCIINDKQYEGGVFTCYLLKGITGSANRNHDDSLTLDEMYSFVSAGVSKTTKGKQKPQLSGSLDPKTRMFDIPKQDILIPELPISLKRKVNAGKNANMTKNGALITAGISTVAGAVLQALAFQNANEANDFRPTQQTKQGFEQLTSRYESNKRSSMVAYGFALTSTAVAGVAWWFESTSHQRERETVYSKPPWLRLKPQLHPQVTNAHLDHSVGYNDDNK
jgi:uncharacterized caspase-like protein